LVSNRIDSIKPNNNITKHLLSEDGVTMGISEKDHQINGKENNVLLTQQELLEEYGQ
jgi:hypothetical protein